MYEIIAIRPTSQLRTTVEIYYCPVLTTKFVNKTI